jgi:hypothetical protein
VDGCQRSHRKTRDGHDKKPLGEKINYYVVNKGNRKTNMKSKFAIIKRNSITIKKISTHTPPAAATAATAALNKNAWIVTHFCMLLQLLKWTWCKCLLLILAKNSDWIINGYSNLLKRLTRTRNDSLKKIKRIENISGVRILTLSYVFGLSETLKFTESLSYSSITIQTS